MRRYKYNILLTEGKSKQVLPISKWLRKLNCHITTVNSSKLDLGYKSRYPT